MSRRSAIVFLVLLLAPLSARGVTVPGAVASAELFPVEPGVDVQRGFAVAVDGDRLAVGAPLDDTAAEDAGAVHLFQWLDGRWEPETVLYPVSPPEKARFGAALALRDGVLAVGAPGEGAAYVFRQGEGGWRLQERVPAQGSLAGFGRSVALGGGRLAVGAVVLAGDGAVYLYGGVTSPAPKLLRVFPGGKGERFGEAVALDEGTLAVGAPGASTLDRAATGAVYAFPLPPGGKPARLTVPGAREGEQVGVAVAISGNLLAATGADRQGNDSAAVYASERGGNGRWPSPVLVRSAVGAALALDGDLLVAGAPAPFSNRTGAVRVLRHGRGGWTEVPALIPGNGEPHDLAGYAVAVRGDRVAVGAVLGDQGGPAAGAAWTFDCPPGAGCTEEGEAVARDPGVTRNVGTALALGGDLLAVGVSPPILDPGAVQAVYVYRRAGTGWRQEARLSHDGFALALRGDLLAVGAPRDPSPVSPPLPGSGGSVSVDQRRHDGLGWSGLAVLAGDQEGEEFGSSLAFLDDDTLAIGAPAYVSPVGQAGAVAIYQRGESGEGGWTRVALLFGDQAGERFGAAVAGRDGFLAVGAPGAGQVKIFSPGQSASLKRTLPGPGPGSAFGASLAFGGERLVVGAPGLEAVYTLETKGFTQVDRLGAPAPGRHFGAAVAVSGDKLLVGQPGDPATAGRAWLFQWKPAGWTPIAATPPGAAGDAAGAAVALDGQSFVVGSPGPSAGDRAIVYALPAGGPS